VEERKGDSSKGAVLNSGFNTERKDSLSQQPENNYQEPEEVATYRGKKVVSGAASTHLGRQARKKEKRTGEEGTDPAKAITTTRMQPENDPTNSERPLPR